MRGIDFTPPLSFISSYCRYTVLFCWLLSLFSYKWSIYLQVSKNSLHYKSDTFLKGCVVFVGEGWAFVVVVVVLFWGGLYFCISSSPENLSELVRCLFVGLFCKLCKLGTKQPWVCLLVCLFVCLFICLGIVVPLENFSLI